jgi:hypothetical protein
MKRGNASRSEGHEEQESLEHGTRDFSGVAIRRFAHHGLGSRENMGLPEFRHDGEENRWSQYRKGADALARWAGWVPAKMVEQP